MKKLYKYIVLVIGILAFSACADEELVGSFGDSGNDVILKLNVQTQAKNNVIVGRAAEDETLSDLHIYVFNEKGVLTGHTSVTGANLTSPNGSVTINAKTGKSYIYAVANIDDGGAHYLLDDNDKKLLKNPDGDVELTLPILKEIKFIRQTSINNTIASPKPEDGKYMMSGYMNDGNPVIIKKIDGITDVTDEEGKSLNTVLLYRIIAKNKLEIRTFSTELDEFEKDENGNEILDENGDLIKKRLYKGKFSPRLYRLCNVPTGGMLIPNTNISTPNLYLKKTLDDGTKIDNITEDKGESSYYVNSSDSAFIFYYPENLQIAKSEKEVAECQENIPSNEKFPFKTSWIWKDRETNKWIPDNSDDVKKKFIYADDNAAYIEIEGTYEYEGLNEENKYEKYNANVTYTIHLGDFTTNIKDFNVIRNSDYSYTVTVKGVEDIIAEATKDEEGKYNEDNPYAEGLVIRTTTGEHYDVDAHYEARVMKFNMAELYNLKREGYGYFLNIETPFEKMDGTIYVKNNGVFSFPDKENPLCAIHDVETQFSKEDLFGWVRFVQNGAVKYKKNNDGSYSEDGTNLLVANSEETHVCRYPGDDIKKYSYTTRSDGTVIRTENYAGGWMNAFELLADLHAQAAEDNDEIVYYTCFIDENYYAKKSWSEYVNREPRTIQIANKLSVSLDKKSVYADVAYSVSQRSIATFYQDTNLKAFGTEIIDEEDKFNNRLGVKGSIDKYTIFPPSTKDADYWNGYTNAVTTNESDSENEGWYKHEITERVNVGNFWDPEYEDIVTDLVNLFPNIQPLYGAVGKACMSRNRDNNGDGKIDDDEVRWYLASVQQYHALYIAQESLPAESKLISKEDLETLDQVDYYSGWPESGHDIRGKYHYYTSSPKRGSGTFWPEEGLTNNGVELANGFTQRAELVRCVRTLVSGNESKAEYGLEVPDKYYKFEKDEEKSDYYTFNLTGIETRRLPMLRLANHNELQPLNELWSKFEVAKESLYGDEEYELEALTSEEYDPCTTYTQEDNEADKGTWRTPNQKEVALMLAELPDEMKARRHGTRTRFSATINDNNPISESNPNGVSWHGPYRWHQRYAFSVETSGKFNVTGEDFINLYDNNNSNDDDKTLVDIRCVRDK